MPSERVIAFTEKKQGSKKQQEAQEKLSKQLLQELTKDAAYRQFKDDAELHKEIGEALAKARKKKKMSVAELAKRVNKSEKMINRMERGEYKQYTMKLLQQLAGETGSRLRIDFGESK